jgi:hypothetical protein
LALVVYSLLDNFLDWMSSVSQAPILKHLPQFKDLSGREFAHRLLGRLLRIRFLVGLCLSHCVSRYLRLLFVWILTLQDQHKILECLKKIAMAPLMRGMADSEGCVAY